MYQYPDEWKRYTTAQEYQTLVTKILGQIFGPEMVRREWDASTHALHRRSSMYYAPNTDIAVGPFNNGWDNDIGNDRTLPMKSHPVYKAIVERNGIGWNGFSRCFLAIEIVFSGAPKYIMGDLTNACLTGSLGFIIARKGKLSDTVGRMLHYFEAQTDPENSPFRNLRIFTDENFLQFLWELLNPEKVWRLSYQKTYPITFKRFWLPVSVPVYPRSDAQSVDDEPSAATLTRYSLYGIDLANILESRSVHLGARDYLVPTTVADVNKLVTKSGETFNVMEILDMGVRPQLRDKGVEGQILDIFEKIARANGCRWIATELSDKVPGEPLEDQKALFRSRGYTVWYDKRSKFSGWSAKKALS